MFDHLFSLWHLAWGENRGGRERSSKNTNCARLIIWFLEKIRLVLISHSGAVHAPRTKSKTLEHGVLKTRVLSAASNQFSNFWQKKIAINVLAITNTPELHNIGQAFWLWFVRIFRLTICSAFVCKKLFFFIPGRLCPRLSFLSYYTDVEPL